jgi:hydrogenase nickel incorporation protein HypB
LPYISFDIKRLKEEALNINPDMKIFEISCLTGEGIQDWYDWLESIVGKNNI